MRAWIAIAGLVVTVGLSGSAEARRRRGVVVDFGGPGPGVVVGAPGVVVGAPGVAVGFGGVRVGVAPPPVRVEVRPRMPRVGYAWVPGYWRWNGRRHSWVRGQWVAPQQPGWQWIEPQWVTQPDGQWVFQEGHWSPPAGVVVAPPPQPVAPAPQAAPPQQPPPQQESQPPAPYAGAVWEPGHWAWSGSQWSWMAGHYR